MSVVSLDFCLVLVSLVVLVFFFNVHIKSSCLHVGLFNPFRDMMSKAIVKKSC